VEIRLSELKRAYPNGGLFSFGGFLYMITGKHTNIIFEIASLNIKLNGWIFFSPKRCHIDDECIVNYIREM
jgi:hypothetical protein